MPKPKRPAEEPNVFAIASAWNRFAADAIDFLLLFAAYVALGAALGPLFYALGPYGRLVSFAILVGYFTFFTSRHGDGRTPGKRVMKLRVVDAKGQPLSVPAALRRSVTIGAILMLLDWNLPGLVTEPWLGIIMNGVLLAGVLGTMYGYAFDDDTRQAPHDLFVGSYVALDESTREAHIRAPQGDPVNPRIIAAFLGVGPLIALGGFFLFSANPLGELERALNTDSLFFYVQVEPTGDRLSLTGWIPEECDRATCQPYVNRLLDTTLQYQDALEDVERIEIFIVNRADVFLGPGVEYEGLTRRSLVGVGYDIEDPAVALYSRAFETFQEEENPAAALPLLDALLDERSGFLEARVLRARVLRALGQPEDALEDADRAVDAAPDFEEARLERALIYRALGQPERALADLRELADEQDEQGEDLNPAILALIRELEADMQDE
ncbi:MAG: RDD family protein [Anaerolineales bacterium]